MIDSSEKKLHIFTHRGLEPDHTRWYPESSYEAFKSQLQRNFGLEFDLNFITNNRIVIAHDTTLSRLTHNRDTRSFTQIEPDDMPIKLNNGHLCFFEELLDLIRKYPSQLHAIHFKGEFQMEPYLSTFIHHMKTHASHSLDKFIVFNVKPETAIFLLSKIPNLHLAPSVSHPYDIERFNHVVKNTLMSIEDAITYKKKRLYDWVWLDEWDRKNADGSDKTLYNTQIFEVLRNVGYSIALASPELHGTSPGLLGGEAHPDAKNRTVLIGRMKEILTLNPDAFCTDYPETVSKL